MKMMKGNGKCNCKKSLIWCLALAGGFLAANVAGLNLACAVNSKKMKKNEKGYNMMHSIALSKKQIGINGGFNRAYLTCLTGSLEVLVEYPTNEEMVIDLTSVIGNVTIRLPKDVKVRVEGAGCIESFADCRRDEPGEEAPTVRIVRRSLISTIVLCDAEE